MNLIIHGKLPSLNDYTKANRSHYHVGAKLKKRVEEIIGWEIKSQLRGVFVKNPCYVKFNWYEANKKRDLDNIASAKKFIFDALVKSGVLKNDGWKQVTGFSDSFFIDKENPRIEVEITEI
jgi:Holliday junction resolvase RusA-like endonuclease